MVSIEVATAFVQATLMDRTVKRHGEKRMAFVGLLASVIGWPLIALASKLWMLFPITFLQSGITGFIWATTGTLAANQVHENEQGQLAGVNVAIAGLMSMLGPLWAGAAYDHVSPGSPYWMGAILLVLACLLLQRVPAKASLQDSEKRPVDILSAAD